MNAKNKKSTLLGKAMSVFGAVGTLIAQMIVGKNRSMISMKTIAKIPAEQRFELAGMLDVDSMFRAKKYDMLIRLGQMELFIKRGLIDELIVRYPKYRLELGQKTYEKVLALVTEDMLGKYLQAENNGKTLELFFLHPLGLKALAKNHYSGFIAANERRFRDIAKNYPPEWDAHYPQKEYQEILKVVLD